MQYNYEYLNDENKRKEIVKQLNELKSNKYSINIQKMYEKIIEIIKKVKGDFNYAKDLIIEDNLKKEFIEYLKLI